MRKIGVLIGGTVGLWLLVAFPARLFWGERGVIETVAAAGLCLVPMVLTLIWALYSRGSSPETQLAAVMGGMAVRMFVVIIAALVLFSNISELNHVSFMLWVVFFYLITLTLEIVLIVRDIKAGQTPTL